MNIEIKLDDPRFCNECPFLDDDGCNLLDIAFEGITQKKETVEIKKQRFSMKFENINVPRLKICIEKYGE